jgi:hypothetical protein
VNYFTPVPKNDQRERATTLSATALQRCFDRLSARLDHRRGPAPFISTWLFATCHSTFPIGIYVVICAIISIIATALLPDYTNKDISPRRIMKSRCSNGERPGLAVASRKFRFASAYCGRWMLGIDGLPGLRLPAAMRQMRTARAPDAAREYRGPNRGGERRGGLIVDCGR